MREEHIEILKGNHQIAAYDNGGKTADRYTVFYMDQVNPQTGYVALVGMSEDPFHPQGFGMHSEGTPGPHNGERIFFCELPEKCRRLVLQDLALTDQSTAFALLRQARALLIGTRLDHVADQIGEILNDNNGE